uniref:Sulfotransferase n=1 Tax=Hucho hucho TaxID=62062 RepID=A0A4W5LI70_9TELE
QCIHPEVSYSERTGINNTVVILDRIHVPLIQMELPPRPKLFDFHGVSMTNYFTDNWDNVQNFQARPDDILIATYPKAGLSQSDVDTAPERQRPIFEKVPFLELLIPIYPPGVEVLDNLTTSPRLIKTHLPVQLLPKSFWEQNCRIVYVARNAKDNAVRNRVTPKSSISSMRTWLR